MNRPMTDRDRAQVAEARIVELEEELRCWREQGRVDLPMNRGSDDLSRVAKMRDALKALYAAIGGAAPARVLLHLLDAHGEIVSKAALLEAVVLDEADEPHIKIVDVYICRLRKALVKAGFLGAIRTLHGIGYCIKADRADDIRAELLGEDS